MKFRVGDVCITQNCKAPLLNNGQKVLIVGINATRDDPYFIVRVDGQPHPSTKSSGDVPQWYTAHGAFCYEYKLRRAVEPFATVTGAAASAVELEEAQSA